MATSYFTAAQKAELESIIQAAIAAAFTASTPAPTPATTSPFTSPSTSPPKTKELDIRVTLIKADKRVATGCKRYLRKHWELASLPPKSGGFSCVSQGETAWCLSAWLSAWLSALLSAYWPPNGAFNGAGFEALGIG